MLTFLQLFALKFILKTLFLHLNFVKAQGHFLLLYPLNKELVIAHIQNNAVF